MRLTRPLAGALACLVALSAAPFPADAAFKTRVLWHAASAVCDTTNPELDSSMRRKANEFRNIGTEPIAVACGTMTDTLVIDGGFSQLVVYLQNNRAGTASASCTINAGTAQDTLYTNKKTVSVALGSIGSLSWTPADYGNTRKHATVSCALPVGWSIRDLAVTYEEYVGD